MLETDVVPHDRVGKVPVYGYIVRPGGRTTVTEAGVVSVSTVAA